MFKKHTDTLDVGERYSPLRGYSSKLQQLSPIENGCLRTKTPSGSRRLPSPLQNRRKARTQAGQNKEYYMYVYVYMIINIHIYMAGWLAGWVAGWLAGWLLGWLAGWLAV